MPHFFYFSFSTNTINNNIKRYFGSVRVGSNLVPDDIDGIPSTHIWDQSISNPTVLLYEAEIDHGSAYKKCRPGYICLLNPLLLLKSLKNYFTDFICDEVCCWLSKEYSKRTFFRIYSNRIEYNDPVVRYVMVFMLLLFQKQVFFFLHQVSHAYHVSFLSYLG
jgi:hypothetical protein